MTIQIPAFTDRWMVGDRFGKEMTNTERAAYMLGVRDSRRGHSETHPVRPFTSDELSAYREGYGDHKAT